jgi:hypothetical protein
VYYKAADLESIDTQKLLIRSSQGAYQRVSEMEKYFSDLEWEGDL